METYLKFKLGLDVFNFILIGFCVYTLVAMKVCEKKGIIDEIIMEEYKFKIKHIFLLPAIITAKIFDKMGW